MNPLTSTAFPLGPLGLLMALTGCISTQNSLSAAVDVPVLQRDQARVIESPPPLSGQFGDFLSAGYAESVADYPTAADHFYRLWKQNPDLTAFAWRAIHNDWRIGQYNRALEVAGHTREKQISSPRTDDNNLLSVIMTLEHFRKDRLVAAKREALSIKEYSYHRYVQRLLLVWIEEAMGNTDEAYRLLEKQMQESALRSVYWLSKILLKMRHNEMQAATSELGGLLSRLDHAPLHYVELYLSLLQRTKGEQAAKDYLDRLPRSDERARLREKLKESGHGVLASLELDNVKSLLAWTMREMGSSLISSSADLTLFYARSSYFLNPNDTRSLLTSAESLFELKRYNDSLDILQGIRQRDHPLSRDAATLEAEALQSLDQFDNAIALIEQTIEQFPDDLELLSELGQLYHTEKKYPEAIATFTRVLELSDDSRSNWLDLYFRGIAYERTDQWPLAEADFQAALVQAPENPFILNYLAYSWIDKRLHIPKALKMLKQAVEISPDNAFIIDSYGWALYRTRQFDEALRYLERAVEMEPAEAVIVDHLGDVYWHVGRKVEAEYQWRRALELGLDEPEQQQLTQSKLDGHAKPQP